MGRTGESRDWTAADEAAWNEAERITDDVIDRGFVCGHPDRGDVFATVRALIAAGYFGREVAEADQ